MATLRPARDDDLEAADALVVASINHLTEQHGFGAIATECPPLLQRFSLRDDPEGLWVAEDEGGIAGFCFSWMNDHLWFLAQLFVRPDRQAEGLGRLLMEKALAHAAARDARSRALITFAFNRVSQGLYIRHGLHPVTPLYVVSSRKEGVLARLGESSLSAEPLESRDASSSWLAAIDEAALGVSRAKHHAYLLGEGGLKGFTFRAGRDRVAYAYLGAEGHVGPVAAQEARHLPDAFRTALALVCRAPGERVSAFLPASSPSVLGYAIEAGMRIALPMLLMGNSLPKPWDRYCPRNPGLM